MDAGCVSRKRSGSTAARAPDGSPLRVLGKSNKERLVPVLPVVAEAVDAYLALCPFTLGARDPLFVGMRGKRLNASVVQKKNARGARCASVCPTPRHRTLCATASPRTCWEAAPTCGLSRSFSGHASLSTTQRYTEVDATHLLETYRKAHPRAQ